MLDNENPKSERKPPIPHSSRYKPSAAKRAKAAFTQLCQVQKEGSSLWSSNLGVKSGTGVIDDVLFSQCHQLASTVHMLAVVDPEASRVVVKHACSLGPQQFKNLQVLLDSLGLEDLSDFLRLMRSSLKNHEPDDSSQRLEGKRPSSSATTAVGFTGRLASAGILKHAGSAQVEAADRSASGTGRVLTSRQRRVRAAAGVFELAQAGFADIMTPAGLGADDGCQQQRSAEAEQLGGSSLSEPSPQGLKFASLLPPGHILVKTAEAIKQQQEFQAALAHITPRPGQQRAVVPPLQLPPLQEQQQGTNLADIHLAGYSRYHPNDLLGSSAGHMDADSGSAGGCSSTLPGLALSHPAGGSGPWRGSLLEGGSTAHPHHPGAFFLSSCGGTQLQGGQGWQLHASGIAQLRRQHVQQQQQKPFRAPGVSMQQLWKRGREATTAAVLEAAHLPVHESAWEFHSLLLVPGLVVQPQVQQQQQRSQLSTPESPGASRSGKQLASRRASTASSRRNSTANNNSNSSRPNSARARPASPVIPPLSLQKLGDGVVIAGGGGSSSRPGSACPSSRLGPAHPAAAGHTACAHIDENRTFVTSTAACMD